jgi:DNA-binding response OmpR family regulator
MAYKILVVDDEPSLSRVLSKKLINEGMDVDIANDGDEALELISKNKYDLILSDLIMPKRNGFELLEQLQKNGVKTPVIVTSNLNSTQDQQKVRSLGAIDFFDKTEVPIFEIARRIKEYIQGGKATAHAEKAVKEEPIADEAPKKKVINLSDRLTLGSDSSKKAA